MNYTKWMFALVITGFPLASCGDSGPETSKSNGPVAEKRLAPNTDQKGTSAFPSLSAPFQRPFRYIGMTIAQAAKVAGGTPNRVGNIVIDSERAHLLLEREGNFISYVDVQLKETKPCSLTRSFDSESILRALSIDPSELALARKQIHYHTYYDHRRKLKVGVACDYEGGPLSVGFSRKYYGM